MKKIITITMTLALLLAMSVPAFAAGITKDAALKKALKNAGLKKSQVKYIETDLDDGMYEVEFTKKSTGKRFDYTISRETGKIIEKSVEYKYKRNSSHSKIGKTAARKKVAKFSGISYKTISKGSCSYEYDDGEGIYEVRFRSGSRSYEYDVVAPTGKIAGYEWRIFN